MATSATASARSYQNRNFERNGPNRSRQVYPMEILKAQGVASRKQ